MSHYSCEQCGKMVKSISGLTRHQTDCKNVSFTKRTWQEKQKQKGKRDESTKYKRKQQPTFIQTITVKDIAQSFF